jgi:hypothetical protein
LPGKREDDELLRANVDLFMRVVAPAGRAKTTRKPGGV